MSEDDGQDRISHRLIDGGLADTTSHVRPFATAYPLRRSCSEGETVANN
jgi:hypothetical protein